MAGPVDSPVVVRRHRLLLTDGPLPCEPYHTAKGIDFAVAEAFILPVGDRAREMAVAWIAWLVEELDDRRLTGFGLVLGSGRPEFTLKQALATHAAMHNAEGWLFREALMRASEECCLGVVGATESAVYDQAAAAAGLSAADLEGRILELGREVGAPWGKDQKLAAAVAWLALEQRS
jgi:hypothetical protein